MDVLLFGRLNGVQDTLNISVPVHGSLVQSGRSEAKALHIK
jgi:hypothetical protein